MAVQEAISIAAQSEWSPGFPIYMPDEQNADERFDIGFSGAMDVALVAIGLLLVWGLDLSVGARAGALGLSFLGIV